MSTGSIRHNIEITDSADAERFVEALEKAKAESEDMARCQDCGIEIDGYICRDCYNRREQYEERQREEYEEEQMRLNGK